jgi:hypothetical protein
LSRCLVRLRAVARSDVLVVMAASKVLAQRRALRRYQEADQEPSRWSGSVRSMLSIQIKGVHIRFLL